MSAIAIAAGLAVALAIYVLSYKDGVVGMRLILIGIGVAAMLHSVTAYVLSEAAEWDLVEASRWLTGSLNGSRWRDAVPVIGGHGRVGADPADPVAQSVDDANSAMTPRAGSGCGSGAPAFVVIVAAVGADLLRDRGGRTDRLRGVPLWADRRPRSSARSASLSIPAALVGALLVLTADLSASTCSRCGSRWAW